jgi:hypothetical protein
MGFTIEDTNSTQWWALAHDIVHNDMKEVVKAFLANEK